MEQLHDALQSALGLRIRDGEEGYCRTSHSSSASLRFVEWYVCQIATDRKALIPDTPASPLALPESTMVNLLRTRNLASRMVKK